MPTELPTVSNMSKSERNIDQGVMCATFEGFISTLSKTGFLVEFCGCEIWTMAQDDMIVSIVVSLQDLV